ncbi:phage major capsid protein [Listeria monocytogenes]|nr:phage major capsid protein [Listeria monocytogenes]EAC7996134.1 phage major capsid protein [Listeria monocytogenes]EAC9137502.1 phage major capsid protein [Listeria monocytogenes]EAE0224380.1 phage major capsid protein [Listeria monocytogenes]EBH4205657.1 phage major capsid protein [Listeria monocytogenes]
MFKDKIKALEKELNSTRENVNTKITEAREKLESGDLDAAAKLKNEIDTLKETLNAKQKELDTLVELGELEEVPNPPETREEDDEERSKKDHGFLDNTNKVDAFERYIRSKGTETRDLTTTNAGVIVPVDITNSVKELKQQELDLSKYATVENVNTKTGKFPIAKRISATLATKEELAEIAKIDEPMFIEVEWDVQTRSGQIVLSEELIEDSAIDVKAYIKKQLARMVLNTKNYNIIKVLSSMTAVAGTGADDIKKAINVTLDPALNKMFIVNQDAFNWLDTLKDSEGRYLLQPDLTAPSGKSLFSLPVEVVSNSLLASKGTQANPKYPIIVGDIEESVAVFNRSEITVEWEKFDRYSQGLAVNVRNDFRKIDPDAARYLEITPPTAG